MAATERDEDDNQDRNDDGNDHGTFAILGRLLGVAGDEAGLGVEGAVVVAGGRIVAVEVPAPAAARLPARRWQGAFVAPGYVDLQVNGALGIEVGDDAAALAALAARLPATGVTAFLPTLVSRTEAEYARAFAAFDAAVAAAPARGAARLLGLHLEGPLLAPARAGAHDRQAIEAADAALVERLVDPARVRLVTLAPERAGALALIAQLRARGVTVALGHTDASFDTFTAGVDAGARLATHLYSAMSPFHHRAPGAVGAALTDERVIATVIADGVHAHAAALRLALAAKGATGLALVTDAVAAAGLPAGTFALAGQQVRSDGTAARLGDGTLAGSTLLLDAAVRNAAAMLALPPAAAVAMATTVPARAIAAPAHGHLTVGAPADIVVLDERLAILATFCEGTLAFGDPAPS